MASCSRRGFLGGLLAAPLGLAAAGVSAGSGERSVALTFDDLPFVAAEPRLADMRLGTRRILDALRAADAPAIGFVNEDRLLVAGERDARVALLEAWLQAGLDLGNHTFGHVGLQATPLAACEEAVLQGEVVTRDLLAKRGRTPRYFRYPFNQTGPDAATRDAFLAFLRGHGYAIAPFTVESSDYVYETLWLRARAAKHQALADRILGAYLAHTERAFEFFEGESRELFSREIPQVFLAHASGLNAAALPELLAMLRRRGYRFVTLDVALADPAYRSEDDYVGPWGPSWLHRWRVARGQDVRAALRREPDPPSWIMELYRAAERRGSQD
jgi:peptidoglycan/xylan/chitin deacetylase (PgdA/CDA1 family)